MKQIVVKKKSGGRRKKKKKASASSNEAAKARGGRNQRGGKGRKKVNQTSQCSMVSIRQQLLRKRDVVIGETIVVSELATKWQ